MQTRRAPHVVRFEAVLLSSHEMSTPDSGPKEQETQRHHMQLTTICTPNDMLPRADGAQMNTYQIAQVNIARMRGPLDSALMATFVARLDEINRLADRSPGFVWRLQAPDGNAPATYLRPYEDDRILFNMSVWNSIEHLKHFVYRSMHVELIRHRAEWFEKFQGAYSALWWVPIGHIPSIDEAKKRLEYLERNGPTQFAFTFQKVFPATEEFQRAIDWSSFLACPAI